MTRTRRDESPLGAPKRRLKAVVVLKRATPAPLSRRAPAPAFVTIEGQRLPVSEALDTLFTFMVERHRIFNRRVRHEPRPWTKDNILAKYPFTNVFRIYDRTSQYVLRDVVQEGSTDLHECCFRVILFRMFNKVTTWQYLKSRLGKLTWRDFNAKQYEQVLSEAVGPLYGHAYIIPAPKLGGGHNYSNHIRLVQLLMEENLPAQLQRFQHLKDAHGWISLFPSMGSFTSLQLLLDLNLTPHFEFNEDEWTALGPGSTACIRKIFGQYVAGRELAALKYLHRTQHEHFARLNVSPSSIPKLCDSRHPGVSMVDLEHALCECEKYCRERLPHIKGKRHQVAKCLFFPSADSITADVPDHWLKDNGRNIMLTRPPPEVSTSDMYEVSHIVAEKASGSSVQYLVRWVGYGVDDDTWQRESDLVDGAGNVLEEWKSTKERIMKRVEEFQLFGARLKHGYSVPMREVSKVKYMW